MITKGIWEDLMQKKWVFHNCKNPYKSKEEELDTLSWLLIFTVLFTPISLILDILILPIEIIYLISRQIIKAGE